MPAIVLISVDLPAPLSPTRAVTWPAGMSRLMSVSACTGPKFFPMPRSRSSGSASFTVTSCLMTSFGVRAWLPAPRTSGVLVDYAEIPAAVQALA